MSKALEEYVGQLSQLTLLKDADCKGSVRWYVNWYEHNFPKARWKYRMAGMAVLAIGLYGALGLKGDRRAQRIFRLGCWHMRPS